MMNKKLNNKIKNIEFLLFCGFVELFFYQLEMKEAALIMILLFVIWSMLFSCRGDLK